MKQKTECSHWTCNGCDECGGWASNPDAEKACVNQFCKCHSICEICVKCDGECHFQEPYGFVPHAGCPLHDSMTEEERKSFKEIPLFKGTLEQLNNLSIRSN